MIDLDLGSRAMRTIRSMKLPLYVRTVLVHQSPNEDFIIPVHPSTNAIIVMDVETGLEVGRVSLVDLPKKESISKGIEDSNTRTTVETDKGLVEI